MEKDEQGLCGTGDQAVGSLTGQHCGSDNQRATGASVGANYRAAQRAKSTPDFISKMGTVEEEADESMYWMELIVEAGLMGEQPIAGLYNEADEILAMTVASIKTARMNKQ